MKIRPSIALVCGVLLAFSAAAYAQVITLEADYWMPFNGDGKTETGYMIDLAKAVFEPKGFTVKYAVTPWSRAVDDARSGKCSGVIGAAIADAPDLVYPKEEQGFGAEAFYVRAGTPWKYAGIQSLKGLKIAVIKDYTYFPELDAYIKANPSRVTVGFGDNPLSDNLRLLASGAVDTIVDIPAVLKYTIFKAGLDKKLVFAGVGGEPATMFIAFSPANPKSKEYARILSEGTAALRKSGKLAKILGAYGLSDWK